VPFDDKSLKSRIDEPMTQGPTLPPGSGPASRSKTQESALKSIRKQLQLLVLSGVTATVLVAGTTLVTGVQVRDATARLIDTKDLNADILPPPLYLIEMRLVLGMAADGSLPVDRANAEVARLGKEYENRIAHWKAHSANGSASVQAVLKAEAGARFVAAAPAALKVLADGDAAAKAAALASVHQLYLAHRQEVDGQVAVAAAEAKAADESIRAVEHQGAIAKGVFFALAVGGLLLAGRRITRTIWLATGGEPAQAAAVAGAVARGNLAVAVPTEAGDQTSVMAAMARMRDQLSGTVNTVRRCSDSIATAAAQIASGNLDLSNRTERQAGNLQQTASAMDQFSGTIRNTAEAAHQATRLAQEAGEVARRGSQAVDQVVGTMQEITASARRIAEITSVIDGIAFQTNILALNAAVEAARAGEQGRGFAVVASEVRSLAQRSATAAKQISELIGSSVQRIEVGGREAEQAGATMGEIVGQVERVGALIKEIGNATQEQTSGIGLVSRAITELDSATQQNTALVEESAAAAATLREQAEELVRAVGVFRTAASGPVLQGA
jgi:methyl-accepting chemotaxis protein